jgi:hypothetical protein
MNWAYLEIISTEEMTPRPPVLFIELTWMLGDGDFYETETINDGFKNENEFIALFKIWDGIRGVRIDGEKELLANFLAHYDMTYDEFMDSGVPSDPHHGIPYTVDNVQMKGRDGDYIHTYKLI